MKLYFVLFGWFVVIIVFVVFVIFVVLWLWCWYEVDLWMCDGYICVDVVCVMFDVVGLVM